MTTTKNVRNKVSRMKKMLGTLFLLVGLATISVSCGIFSDRFGPTPDISNLGVRQHLSVEMPFTWDCSVITEVSPGIKWRGLQIGVTTYDEMVSIFNPDKVYRTTSMSRIVFQHGEQTWKSPEEEISACFLGSILSALEIFVNSDEFPQTPESLIEIYGEPDRITWGFNELTRTMIWADVGIMVNIEYPLQGDVHSLDAWPFFLFPPMDAEELEESWIMQVIPAPPTAKELAKMPLAWRVEDPWGYNKD